jgi:hypothetical protein
MRTTAVGGKIYDSRKSEISRARQGVSRVRGISGYPRLSRFLFTVHYFSGVACSTSLSRLPLPAVPAINSRSQEKILFKSFYNSIQGVNMKKIITAFLIIICCLAITACGSRVKSEQEIISAIMDSEGLYGEVESFEILKRDTDRKAKNDCVWCWIVVKNDAVRYERGYRVESNYYSDGGWIFDSVSPYLESKWQLNLVRGINEAEIEDVLNGFLIMVDKNVWELNGATDVRILDQETSLSNNTDIVRIHGTVFEDIQKATGEFVISLVYKRNLWTGEEGWVIDRVDVIEPLTVEYLEGYDPNIQENDIIQFISGETLLYSYFYMDQTLNIEADKMKDFTLTDQVVTNQGARIIQGCHFIHQTDMVDFGVNGEIQYEYNGSTWDISPQGFKAEVRNIDIAGEWLGTYDSAAGTMTMLLSIEHGEAESINITMYPDVKGEGDLGENYQFEVTVNDSLLEVNVYFKDYISIADNCTLSSLEMTIMAEDNVLEAKLKFFSPSIKTESFILSKR